MSSSTERSQTSQILSWWPGTFSRERAADLLLSLDLGFDPTMVAVDDGPQARDYRFVPFPEARQALADPSSVGWNIQATRNVVDDPLLRLGAILECDCLDASNVVLPGATVAALSQLDGFTTGTLGDSDDVRWQSERNVSNYETFGRPHEHLPRAAPKRGREQIDVTGNPGRLSVTLGARLWAGTDVWFGPAAGRVMDYAKVPTIPVGTLTELPNDRYHLHLFDLGDPLEEIREKQAALRAHLDWDRIEAETPSPAEIRERRRAESSLD